MRGFSNLSYVHSYISVSLIASREMQAFVLRLVSINNQKEQTARSNIHSVSNARSLSPSFSTGYTPEPKEGLQLPWRAQPAGTALPPSPPTCTALSE